jgi:four helix bundle protein
MGSASELEYQLLLAFELGYIEKTIYAQVGKNIGDIKRMLTKFIQKLTTDN